MQKGKLAILAGPSAGVGKDSIIKIFLARHPDWHVPVSVTTRPPRPGEVDGQDMYFVDTKTFQAWQQADKFLETDFHADHWYGTLFAPVEDWLLKGENVLLRIDVNGALVVKQKRLDAKLIFIKAEDFSAMEHRIQGRGSEDPVTIQNRLKLAEHELTFEKHFDQTIINRTGQIEQAVDELEKQLTN